MRLASRAVILGNSSRRSGLLGLLCDRAVELRGQHVADFLMFGIVGEVGEFVGIV